jgi:hypothetical protein
VREVDGGRLPLYDGLDFGLLAELLDVASSHELHELVGRDEVVDQDDLILVVWHIIRCYSLYGSIDLLDAHPNFLEYIVVVLGPLDPAIHDQLLLVLGLILCGHRDELLEIGSGPVLPKPFNGEGVGCFAGA